MTAIKSNSIRNCPIRPKPKFKNLSLPRDPVCEIALSPSSGSATGVSARTVASVVPGVFDATVYKTWIL